MREISAMPVVPEFDGNIPKLDTLPELPVTSPEGKKEISVETPEIKPVSQYQQIGLPVIPETEEVIMTEKEQIEKRLDEIVQEAESLTLQKQEIESQIDKILISEKETFLIKWRKKITGQQSVENPQKQMLIQEQNRLVTRINNLTHEQVELLNKLG